MSLWLSLAVPTYRQLSRVFVRYKSSSSSKRWLQRQKDDYYSRSAKHENLKSRAAFKLLQVDQKYRIFHSSGGKPMNVVDLGAAPGAWNQVALERCPANSKILGVDILPYQPPRGVSSMQANILSKRTHEQIRDFFASSEKQQSRPEQFEDIEISTSLGSKFTVTEAKILAEKEEKKEDTKRPAKPTTLYDRPIDVVLSDMYVPYIQVSGFANATTNNPYIRMANTSGLSVRDHGMSMDLCDAALIVAIDLLRKGGKLVMKFFTGDSDKNLEKRLRLVFNKVHRFKPKASHTSSKECYFVCLGKKENYVDKLQVFRK